MSKIRNRKPAAIGMIIYCVILLLLFYSYYYADFYETGLEGVRFWDILFSGQIRHFYTQVFLIGKTQYIPLYDFPMYIVFAVWNFPLWIVQKVSSTDIYHSIPCLMWMKSMLLFWLVLFLKEFSQVISLVCGSNKDKSATAEVNIPEKTGEGCVLFLTSSFFMTGIVVLGQYDIISMTFMMAGLRAYLKGDDRRFVLWFAIAAPFKYFSILAFIPLILLEEKKIHRILLRIVEVLIPVLFFWIAVPYGRPELVPGCTFSGSSSGTNVAKPVFDAFYVRGSIAFGTLFVYFFAWTVFLILCYAYKPVKRTFDTAVYVCFMAYMIQFTFGYSHPYWLILMAPFMILLILQNEDRRYLNLLLETIGTAAMTVAQIMYYNWCFNSNIVNLSFWKNILPDGVTGMTDWFGLSDALALYISDDRLQEYVSGAALSIYAACILIFALINCSLLKEKIRPVNRGRESCSWMLPVRAVMTILMGLVPLGLFVYRALFM